MKFKELVNKFYWEEIEPVFQQLYPEEKSECYKFAFNELKVLESVEYDMVIHVKKVIDEYDETEYFSVDGTNGDLYKDTKEAEHLKPEILDKEVRYALEYTEWENWLGMTVSDEDLQLISEKEFTVHCLWEMTFHASSSEDMKTFINEFSLKVEGWNNEIDEIKNKERL